MTDHRFDPDSLLVRRFAEEMRKNFPLNEAPIWDGKCAHCGEDELEGGSDGGKCLYCGETTMPPEPHPSSP